MSLANKPIYSMQEHTYHRRGVELVQPKREGMTLLEHYAGLALQGLCASSSAWQEMTIKEMAVGAIERAKALIEQLEKEK